MRIERSTALVVLSVFLLAAPERAGAQTRFSLRLAEEYNDNVEVLFEEEQAGPDRFSPSFITDIGAGLVARLGEVEGVRFTLKPEANAKLFKWKRRLSFSRLAPEIIASWKPAADILLTAADEYTLLAVPQSGQYTFHRNVAYLSWIFSRWEPMKLKLEYRNKLKVYPEKEAWNFFTNALHAKGELEIIPFVFLDCGYGVQHNLGSAGRRGVEEVKSAEGYQHLLAGRLRTFVGSNSLLSVSWELRRALAGSFEEGRSPNINPGGNFEEDSDETSNGGFIKSKLELYGAFRPIEKLSLSALLFYSKKSYDRLVTVNRGDWLRKDEMLFLSFSAQYVLKETVSCFLKYMHVNYYSNDRIRQFENSVISAGFDFTMILQAK